MRSGLALSRAFACLRVLASRFACSWKKRLRRGKKARLPGPATSSRTTPRVGAHATDGSVLMTEETARRLDEAFHHEDLGPQQFKNVAEATRVFRLVSLRV